ncbi:MAG: MBL fold metallo-hydrolase, partial [Acidimicrobiia bacterium]|nr:MBL fold metallo-hydrolase [Acidimicrobiia bacterium]
PTQDPPASRPPREEALRATEEITEAAPGILRLQLPIRMPGLGHVNCYALEDEKGWTVVDPGMPGPKPWKAMTARFRSVGFDVRHIHTVIVTHSHVDHFGGSGRLRKEAGATVVASTGFRTWWDPDDVDDPEVWEGVDFDSHAVPWDRPTPWGGEHPRPPASVRLRYRVLRPVMKRWFPTPRPSLRLADAATTRLGGRDWVAVHTPGHTPDHLCLFDPEAGVLLSGDHVLPTITPHISGVDAGPDPLAAFVDSLHKVGRLEGVKHVLPAHGHPFTDLHGRIDAIHRHHDERLERLTGFLADAGEATVVELSQKLFRPAVWGAMADSETFAHLEHLRLSGAADRREIDPGPGGMYRYHLT